MDWKKDRVGGALVVGAADVVDGAVVDGGRRNQQKPGVLLHKARSSLVMWDRTRLLSGSLVLR